MRTLIERHAVTAYYLTAFGVSWGAVLLLVGPGGFVGTTATSPEFPLVGLASLLGPSVAGILMTGIVGGRAGFRDLLSRMTRWRVAGRWYAWALLTGPLVTLAVLLLLSLGSAGYVPAILTAEDRAGLLLAGAGAGLVVPVLEELGWTGFVTPALRERRGVLTTGLTMGILWGAWHLPLFAGSTASSGEVPPLLYLAAMLFSWLIPYRVLMVWVHDRTQSVLVATLMHFPAVVSQYVLVPEAISGGALFVFLLAYAGALWLVVGGIVLAGSGRTRPGPDSGTDPG